VCVWEREKGYEGEDREWLLKWDNKKCFITLASIFGSSKNPSGRASLASWLQQTKYGEGHQKECYCVTTALCLDGQSLKSWSCLNTAFRYYNVGHYCWWKEFTVFTLTQLTPLTFVFSHMSAVYSSFQLACLGRDGVRKTIHSTGIHTRPTSLLLNYQDVQPPIPLLSYFWYN